MKDKLKSRVYLAALLIMSVLYGCGSDNQRKHIKNSNENPTNIDAGENLYKPVNETVLSNVKTIKLKARKVPFELNINGYITYDAKKVKSISSRLEGRIEKLFIKTPFQTVKQGQPIMEIFSHELLTAQNEYILLKQTDPNARDLINASYNRLLSLGMTEKQLTQLKDNSHVHPTTAIYSPYDGFVIESDKVKPQNDISMGKGSSSMSGNMDPSPKVINNGQMKIREGVYVAKGEPIFNIVSTDLVWAVFEMYENQVQNIRLNQKVQITVDGISKNIDGKVNFIEPAYREGATTIKVIVHVRNPDKEIKINSLASAKVNGFSNSALWVPKSSVVDLGTGKAVFLKNGVTFKSRRVITGASAGDFLEVIEGLNENDEIAVNAGFMVDSESLIGVSNK